MSEQFSFASSSETPSICILALSQIADDPRVRRQGETFHRAGWKVTAIGLPGAKSPSPEWAILTRSDLPAALPNPSQCTSHPEQLTVPPKLSLRQLMLEYFRLGTIPFFTAEAERQKFELKVKKVLGAILQLAGLPRYRLRLLAIRLRPALAEKMYWNWSGNILDIYACGRRVKVAVWLANDWTMLPVAARLARENGGIYGYDTHEFAIEEFAERPQWRLCQRPMVDAIEREFIGDAAVVSAVSSGIAKASTSFTICPPRADHPQHASLRRHAFSATQRDRINVLYHGIVVPNRGLEAAIDSVALWRPEFNLTIRGPGNGIRRALRERIAGLGLEHRVRLAPPVPMTALVREAAQFDVGFFALPGHSRHNEFALPNKFFEYVMAGLALCTTDLPEMARLIRQYDLGVTIAAVEPVAIAAAINALDPDRIDRFKRHALAAAGELCWDRELSAWSMPIARCSTRRRRPFNSHRDVWDLVFAAFPARSRSYRQSRTSRAGRNGMAGVREQRRTDCTGPPPP